MNRVLVLHETNGMRIIDVSTDKRLYETCLAIVNDRKKMGYYDPPTPPTDIGFNSNHLKKLPGKLKDVGRTLIANHKADKLAYESKINDYAILEKAITENDGVAALAYLQTRTSHHSEDFEIVKVLATYEEAPL